MSPTGIILAAGRGQRLRPVTDGFAKPVLQFAGKPLMVWALEALCRAGVGRIGVNAWYRPEQIEAVVARWGDAHAVRLLESSCPEITVVREQELMGTGGGARAVWEALGRPSGPVIVANGDIVTDVELAPHLQAHAAAAGEEGVAATLLVSEVGEGRVFAESSGRRVIGLPGRHGPSWATPSVTGRPTGSREVSFVGVSILEPEALLDLPSTPGCILRDGLSRRLLAQGAVAASVSADRHLDVGTPTRWWHAVTEALAGAW